MLKFRSFFGRLAAVMTQPHPSKNSTAFLISLTFLSRQTRFIFIGIILGFWLTACEKSSPRMSGGQDSGGGNTSQEKMASSQEILESIQKFHRHRTELFRAMTYAGLVSHRILKTEAALRDPLKVQDRAKFLIQNRFWELLKVAEPLDLFTIEAHEKLVEDIQLETPVSTSCHDRAGVETDGSIVTDSSPGICLSPFRLKTHLSSENFQIEVLALYIHELTHLFGATEIEADQFQKVILSMGSHPETSLVFLNETSEPSAKKHRAFLTSGVAATEEMKSGKCDAFSKWNQSYFDFFMTKAFQQQGLMAFSLKSQIQLHAIFVLTKYANDFCVSDLNPEKTLRKQKFWSPMENSFHSRMEISGLYPDPLNLLLLQSEDQKMIYTQYLLADLAQSKISLNDHSATVHWVDFGDMAANRQNLHQLKEFLLQVLNEIED